MRRLKLPRSRPTDVPTQRTLPQGENSVVLFLRRSASGTEETEMFFVLFAAKHDILGEKEGFLRCSKFNFQGLFPTIFFATAAVH